MNSEFFDNPVQFGLDLKRRNTCGHPHVVVLAVKRDFTTLGLDSAELPEGYSCCKSCGIAYMTSFNVALGVDNPKQNAKAVMDKLCETRLPAHIASAVGKATPKQ